MEIVLGNAEKVCMDAILSENKFADFGADTLYPFPRIGLRWIEGDAPESLRRQVRELVPRDPGVYGMVDLKGRLIYVGKSKVLRNRLLSYFLPGNEEDKSGRIVQSTVGIVWETQPSEFAALVREQSLIRQFRPRFNSQGVPRRQQQVFVCLGRGPAEQFYVARRYDASARYVLGPLSGAGRAGRAVDVLNRLFRLRDCSSRQTCSFTDQLQLFEIELRPGCLRLEIGSCLGPCVGACSRNEYESSIENAQAFLAGEGASAIESLQASMRDAAENRHFEQALRIQEDLQVVQWLSYRAADVAMARERYSFVYPVLGSLNPAKRTVWYLIRHGMIEGAIAAPLNSDQWVAASRIVGQWWTQPDLVGSPFSSRAETLALVASWFRKHPGELKRTFAPNRDGVLSESKRRFAGSSIGKSGFN